MVNQLLNPNNQLINQIVDRFNLNKSNSKSNE